MRYSLLVWHSETTDTSKLSSYNWHPVGQIVDKLSFKAYPFKYHNQYGSISNGGFWLGSAMDPALGELSAPPDPIAGFKGPTSD